MILQQCHCCLIFCCFPGCFGGFPRAALRFFLPAEQWRCPVLPKHFLMCHAPFSATVTKQALALAQCLQQKRASNFNLWIWLKIKPFLHAENCSFPEVEVLQSSHAENSHKCSCLMGSWAPMERVHELPQFHPSCHSPLQGIFTDCFVSLDMEDTKRFEVCWGQTHTSWWQPEVHQTGCLSGICPYWDICFSRRDSGNRMEQSWR